MRALLTCVACAAGAIACVPVFESAECFTDCIIDGGRTREAGEPDAGGEVEPDGGRPPSTARPGWQILTTTTAPSPRWRELMIYSPKNRAILLHGGISKTRTESDTWLFDGVWHELHPAMPTGIKTDHSGSEDRNENIVIFGGNTRHGGPWNDETWLWDGATWNPIDLPEHPSAHVFAAMAYDPFRKVAVLGGVDTWEWDGARWEMKAPPEETPGRENFTMWFDPARAQVMIYGGGANGSLDDAWSWDGSHWQEVQLSNGPGQREAYSAAFDLRRGELVMHSGMIDPRMHWQAGTWLLRGNRWTLLETAIQPDPTIFGAAAYDRASGRVVLFGGDTDQDNKLLDGTWILE